jgi:hypothetical protein
MKIRTLRKTAAVTAIVAGLSMLGAPPAAAQTYGRGSPVSVGEPTDPDAALQLVEDSAVDLEDYGLATQAPENESEALTWFEQLLQLLRNLGLIADAGND